MSSIVVPFNYTPRDYQIPPMAALDAGIKRVIAMWHRRAGKEKTFVNYCAKAMLDRVGTYFYFFPTYAQAKKAIWDGKDRDGFPFIAHFPDALVKSKHSTDLKIEYWNGSIFQLIGTDNIDSIMSTNPIGCVFAEYSLQDPRAWEYVRPILSENGGWAAFDFTPRGKNHAFDLYTMALNNHDWFVQKLVAGDSGTKRPDGTPVISDKQIDDERRAGMDEDLIQQEYFCSFEGVQRGSYYGKQLQAAREQNRITRVPYEEGVGVETWWDIGVGDSTAIWFTQTVGKEVRVIEYFEASGESIAYFAKELQSRPYVYTAHHGPHDLQVREWGNAAEDGRPRARIDSAAQLGIKFQIVPNLSVDDGINAVRSILSMCWFDAEKCKRGLAALESYHKDYDEKKQCFRSYPVHDWSSHGADGFRYFAVGHRFSKPKTPPKGGMGSSGRTTFMAD